ncbi:MAG: hypothetical protein CVU57_02425 [Deltaproteobacteria bacterium HGW-Deltaproteobacteria-15]|nr:MAG: hypothetical protein CVU57_02425 [Deltaproteobacteria bacterium HGW-Deltaproteobacteria-15]
MSDYGGSKWKIRGASLKDDHYNFLHSIEKTGLFSIDDKGGTSTELNIVERGSEVIRAYINPKIILENAIIGYCHDYKGHMKYQKKVPEGKEGFVRELFSRFRCSEGNDWGFCTPGGKRTAAGEKHVWVKNFDLAEMMLFSRYEVQFTNTVLSGVAFITVRDMANLPDKLEVTLVRRRSYPA